jgi:hypothetical protein
MKQNAILSGVVATMALCAMDASAQFNYHNGDLIAAFGNGGSTDVIVDLGAISNFQPANWATYSWNLNSILTSTFGSVSSGVYWSVFGVNDTSSGGGNPNVTQGDPNTIWATLARSNPANQTHPPHPAGSSASYQLPLIFIQTIADTTSPGLASPGLIQDYAPGEELVDTSLGGFSPMMNNPYNGDFQGTWYYNTLNHGVGVSDLYQNDPGVSPSTYLGDFSLNSSGVLTYNPIPEPSTWAMFGSGVLALFALRRRNR